MKHLLITLFFCAPVALLSAQTISLTPNPVFGEETEEYEVTGEAVVKNLASTAQTFRWTRTIIRLDFDTLCQTQVTDPYNHWFPAVYQRNFPMAPGQEGPLHVALWDFDETGCCAIVHMKVINLDVPTDSVEAFYYLRTCAPLAVKDQPAADIEVYPNPASHFFALKNAENVRQIAVCNANGQLIRRQTANASQQYTADDLPRGAYYLVLENAEGQILQVLQWVKGE
jgi:hypothetical protein